MRLVSVTRQGWSTSLTEPEAGRRPEDARPMTSFVQDVEAIGAIRDAGEVRILTKGH
jgi:hypothetical protein